MKTLRYVLSLPFGYLSIAVIGMGLLLAWLAAAVDGDGK